LLIFETAPFFCKHPVFTGGKGGWGLALTTYPHLVPRLVKA